MKFRGLLFHAIAQLNQAGGQRGILPTIQDLWRTEGIRRGFFKGMLYPIISNGAINSIFFGVYGSLLPRLQVVKTFWDWCDNFVAERWQGWCWLPQRLFGRHCWRRSPAWSCLPCRACQGLSLNLESNDPPTLLNIWKAVHMGDRKLHFVWHFSNGWNEDWANFFLIYDPCFLGEAADPDNWVSVQWSLALSHLSCEGWRLAWSISRHWTSFL